ncbi:MAG: hypothetical protein H2172_02025 [Opitutus sp.]|nr:hypothetical protein [Opitutus sp.]MCS6248335.1 hypothetical protein [Opitutus sp.]MCS6275049.1 hypothetical protein [Opitutus sp.]MCS6278181.1 hypothetical protein [Opitutus sp.]MCS6299291.1 hypothetical protein [Opitutus sp.]
MAPSRHLRHVLLLIGAIVSLALVQAAPSPPKVLSATVAAELDQLRTLTDSRAYPAALSLIERLLAHAANPSFDLAVLSQVKGQIFLAEARYEQALAPLQLAVELGERHGFFDENTRLDTLFLLGQLHAQLAATPGTRVNRQRNLASALDYARRWQAQSPRPSAEVQLFIASTLYQSALLDPAKPDLAQLELARLAAAESLLLENTPREASYVLLLASQQQLGQREASADTLELLVKAHSATAVYWQQLVGTYLTLASDAPDPVSVSRYQLCALLSFERAQVLGHLTTAQDQATLLALRAALDSPATATAGEAY